jgi:hypothetical protein
MMKAQLIKDTITPAEAAAMYGIDVGRNGMACCPFHPDHNPSMKLYDDHYYCFACNAHGDVIDLASGLLKLPFRETVERLETDFGIRKGVDLTDTLPEPASDLNSERKCISVLKGYIRLLSRRKEKYAPKTQDTDPDPRFAAICSDLDYAEFLEDHLNQIDSAARKSVLTQIVREGYYAKMLETLKEAENEEEKE